MQATPDEVLPLHAPFEIVLRGFHRQQVLDHLESLEARLEMIAADRDTALRQAADLSKLLDHLRREAEEASDRVERLQRSSLGGAGLRIQRMLQLAEDEVAAVHASAEQETTSLRERTRAEADRLLRETTQRCERLAAESERRRKTAEAESAARCRQAEQESERRRQLAEQQSAQGIARRETEAADRIREYQTRGVTGLYRLMYIVGERLSTRLSEIKQEIVKLMELRAEVTAQLSAVHGVLVAAVDRVQQPLAVEQEEHSDDPPKPMQSGAVVLHPAAPEPRPQSADSPPAESASARNRATTPGQAVPPTEFRPAVAASVARWKGTG